MTEHALIMCREPGRHSTLDKGHEEGGSAYANAGSSLRSPPGYSRASPPQKNQSLPTVLLCALTSDFTGGCPPQHHLSGSGIAPLEFYHCWEPVRNSAHDKGHEEGGSAYAKAGSSFRSPPGNSRAYTPKTRVCLLSACAFT